MPFEFIRSELLLQGRNFNVRRDTLKTPSGHQTTLEIVEHDGSVVLVPVDEQGNILFVRQYRPAAGRDLLELPAGTRNGKEPFEECAAREIREETGMEAGRLQKLGEFYVAPGYSNEYMAVFLATELKPNPLDADEDEFLELERFGIREVGEMFGRGEVPDSKSLAAWMLAKPHLEKYFG
ncbi:MAG: NUDIX hydrolase [Bacteroidota bacterium]